MKLTQDEFKEWIFEWNDGNTFIHLINEWEQMFLTFRLNWVTFTLIKIEFEDERMLGGLECEVIFLGFGFRFRHNYDPSILEEMSKTVDK